MTLSTAAVLLASGRGQRFDASGTRNKLLERVRDGRIVLRASAQNLLAAIDPVVVVVPPEFGALGEALAGLKLRIVVNPRAAEGMGTSIAAGVAALSGHTGWLVALGDMPFVTPQTVRALAEALERGASIVAPRYAGERGHPVGFAAQHYDALTALEGDVGARALLQDQFVRFVDVPDSGILSDIDRPADLAR